MKKLFFYISVLFLFYSCNNIIEENTPANVFEVFWRTMDEKYPFFEEKGVDWDSIYDVYAPKARAVRNDRELLDIFRSILPLFQDGHLWVHNPTITTTVRSLDTLWWAMRRNNVDALISNGFEDIHLEEQLLILENKEKRIAYIKLNTFNYQRNNISTHQPENFLKSLDFANGLIIDLSDNSGGHRSSTHNFVSAFFAGRKIIYYTQEKTGRGRNDFSSKIPVSMRGKGYVPDSVPIVILTSINTFSGGNFAVYILSDLRNCTVIGRTTSDGGASLSRIPLPNGWILGFPTGKSFSPSGRNMEFGFEPDVFVEVKEGESFRNNLLLTALEYLDGKKVD